MAIDWGQVVLGPNIAIFGELFDYQTNADIAFSGLGIYDEAYQATDPLTIEGISTMHITNTRPCLGVRLSDFQTPPDQGDLVTVRGRRFYVQEVQPDGRGGAKLLLNNENGQR